MKCGEIMRYTFGGKFISKSGERCEGLYTFGKYGLPELLAFDYLKDGISQEKFACENRILIAENLEDAKAYVNNLSHAYKREFDRDARRSRVDRAEFGFYLLKVDSPIFKGYDLVSYPVTAKKDGFPNIRAYQLKLKNGDKNSH